MAFIRKIKKGNSTYLVRVESYRQDGKVKQRVLEYLGKEEGDKIVRKRPPNQDFDIVAVRRFTDVAAITAIVEKLELKSLLGKDSSLILSMVYSHLLDRESINKMPEWFEKTEILNELKIKKITSKKLYEALQNLSNLDFSIVEKSLSRIFKEYDSDDKVAVLDITDTYFAGSKANWKARRGKDGKYDKLMQIALAVTLRRGFPIAHKTYEGNISNVKVFEDVVAELATRGYSSVITDRGSCSRKNILNFQEYGFKMIMGYKTSRLIEREYLSKIDREEIFSKKHLVNLKATKVYVQSFDYMNSRLIAVFNPKIETAMREKQIEADKPINKYNGYSLIYTNCDLTDEEVVKMYFEKDVVERSFKKMKGALDLHPLRASNIEHIKNHIKICYLAFAILSLIEFLTKSLNISGHNVIKTLEGGYKIEIKFINSEKTITKTVTLKNIQMNILDALGVVYK